MNSRVLSLVASLIGISSKTVLTIITIIGSAIAFISIYGLLEYVFMTLKERDSYEISRMLNLLLAIFYILGFLMRKSTLKFTDLLYFSHGGGIFSTVVSLKYAIGSYKNMEKRRNWRCRSTVVWTLIFLYMLFGRYIFGDYTAKTYFFSHQTFYHVISPLLSIISYVFFEEHALKWSNCLFILLFNSTYCLFNIAYPIVFKTISLYTALDIKNYGVESAISNFVFVLVTSFVFSVLFINIDKIETSFLKWRNNNEQ